MPSPKNASDRSTRLRARLTPVGVLLVLMLHAWLAVSATRHESCAVDEMAHLTAGHVMWAKGDYRLQPENGVLPQLWEGLPAWLRGRQLPPPSDPGWSRPSVWWLGHTYFHQLGNDLAGMLLDGRAMNVVWSLATGVLIFAWARRLFGERGGWVALAFWTFCPTFLAHGALATSDMCMTFFMLASVGLYWRHLHDFRWQTGLASAGVLGLAFVAKFSAVLLPVMLVPLAVLRIFAAQPMLHGSRTLTKPIERSIALLASAIVHFVVVVAVIWLFHGFRYAPVSDPSLIQDYTRPWAVVLDSLGGPLARILSWARSVHVLPDAYLYGFGFVVDLSQERGAFLNGATSLTGWVQFFPYAFLVKTPLPLLLAMVTATSVALWRWRQTGWTTVKNDLGRVAPLLALFAVYWVFSLTSKLNIGHRHLLPIYPVIFIGIGALGWAMRTSRRIFAVIVLGLIAGQVAASSAVRPHYLAFFNQLAGGPSEGYRHLVDSSLDWGQDLPGLADWLRAHPTPAQERVYLAYFGTDDPEYYGIRALPMVPLLRAPLTDPWYRLGPGTYCISATMLSQAYSSIREPWSLALEQEYQRFRSVEPALLDYAANPGRRSVLERDVAAEKWRSMWKQYDQLRFTRLCYYLRTRKPDAQIGYSINIYRLNAEEIETATTDTKRWTDAIEKGSVEKRR